MKKIEREIKKQIKSTLFKGKVIILYGARQVGKTTLVKEIQNEIEGSAYFNCEEPYVRDALEDKSSGELKDFVGNHKLVILDEAQSVKNIGRTLKLFIDNYPEIQILATGSSSFDLANEVVEPLTGRKIEFELFPLSVKEIVASSSKAEFKHNLKERLVYGMYPGVVSGAFDRKLLLKDIAKSYAYKDILKLENIRNPEALEKLLVALALQIGNEVSYRELAETVGIDKETVKKYIRILEQAFIIFRLRPFNKNARNELRRLRKVYFVDVGLRNALIGNFASIDKRCDVGGLWENFLVVERIKRNRYSRKEKQEYFWRTKDGKSEIDFLEIENEKLHGFEFKWNPKKSLHIPKAFKDLYPQAKVDLINRDNFLGFVL